MMVRLVTWSLSEGVVYCATNMLQETAPLSHPLAELLAKRIVIIDGAMGTTIQQYQLTEEQFRGERFKDWKGKDLEGNNELLNLTQPQIIEEIHRRYFEAGADIVETNTFNAQLISL